MWAGGIPHFPICFQNGLCCYVLFWSSSSLGSKRIIACIIARVHQKCCQDCHVFFYILYYHYTIYSPMWYILLVHRCLCMGIVYGYYLYKISFLVSYISSIQTAVCFILSLFKRNFVSCFLSFLSV